MISGAILFIREAFVLTNTAQEITMSAVLIGAAVNGFHHDHHGFHNIWAGALFSALTPDVYILIVSRIGCVVIGMASFIVPIYIAEVAPIDIRGGPGSLNQLAITIGIVTSYMMDLVFAPCGGWRWMFVISLVPSLILAVGMYLMPPSPRWLLNKGFEATATTVLQKIRGIGDVSRE